MPWPRRWCWTANAASACAIPCVAHRMRRVPHARSWSVPARSIRRNCWSCRASASRSVCAILASRCVIALPGVGENLRDHYAPRTRWAIGAKGITYNDTARGLGLVRQALRYAVSRDGLLGAVGGADPCVRTLPRRPRSAGRAAGLGADADRAGPARSDHLAPVRHDLLRASDAAGEQGAHPRRVRRSAPATVDQLQLSVVADRCARSPRARCASRVR